MRILIKTLVIIVLLILLAIGGLAAYLTLVFDPNDYRSEIETRARDAAGIELKINGDIGWSIYPWLALELNDLRLGYQDKPQLAQLGQASAALNIPALLGGEVQIDSVLVSGLKLDLILDKEGRDNWTGTIAAKSSDKPEASEIGSRDMTLAIDQIQLADAEISYQDQATQSQVLLSAMNLQANSVGLQSAFPIQFSGKLVQSQGTETLVTLDLKLDTNLFINLADMAAQLDGLKLSGEIQPAGLPNAQKFELSSDISVSQSKQQLSLNKLILKAGDLSATGTLNINDFSVPVIDGELNVAQFNPRALMESLGVDLPELGEGALTALSMSTKVGGSAEAMELSGLTIKLDSTAINGNLSYAISSGLISADIKGDSIDLDKYMPAATTTNSGEGSASAAAQKGWSQEILFDLSPIKTLQAMLNLSFDKILYQGNEISGLNLKAKASGGKVDVTQLSATAFGGKINATASADAREATPKFSFNPDLQGIAIEQLLALSMEQPPVMARVNLAGDITTNGDSLYALVNSLNGKMKLTANEGVIQGIDVAQELCQNIENLTALGVNPDQVDRTTPIADLVSNFNIAKGVVTNPDFGASIDAAKLDAKGTVDLPKQSFDYNLGLTLTDDLFQQSCGINPALKNTRIPVNCQGTFDADPAKLCKLDPSFIGEMIKKAIADKAKQKVEEKIQESVGEKLKGEAGNLLKGLFGN